MQYEVVTSVEEGSNAAAAGLSVGDVFLFIDKVAISSIDHFTFKNALKSDLNRVQIVDADGQPKFIKHLPVPLGITYSEQDLEKQSLNIESFVKLSTTPEIPNRKTEESIDVITAECVFGMNLFKDLFSEVRDIFGGRSKTNQNALREAREVCLHELRVEALFVGANAVVGIDLDYSEISGGGKSMLFLVASGTAVKLAD
ncbi:heavy metal-binding domain-containing protein [Litorivicinus sp.]|nr:heavy metal-binding domain-containing protein [Litorivicinus sp.]